jgi:hypothetical protein
MGRQRRKAVTELINTGQENSGKLDLSRDAAAEQTDNGNRDDEE